MKKQLLFFILVLSFTGLFAQEFSVPQNYSLKKPEDFTKYEKDVIQCIDWLMATPMNKQVEKRKEANAFLLAWMSDSPKVSITVFSKIVNFSDKNPELLMVFMSGWTKYSIETSDYSNIIVGNVKGIERVIEFYKKNKEFLEKDSNVEDYIKMQKEGKLEEFIKKNAVN